jgi:hypothetical protein
LGGGGGGPKYTVYLTWKILKFYLFRHHDFCAKLKGKLTSLTKFDNCVSICLNLLLLFSYLVLLISMDVLVRLNRA